MGDTVKLKDEEFIRLVKFLKSNYGINLEKKRQLIEGRLCNLVMEKGFQSFDAYFETVFNGGSKDELAVLLNKLTTNHTFFMREAEHFQYFQSVVLPQLAGTIKNRDLRIWSAGCSSGEEPYTLAMILQDYFILENKLWDKKILATDISEAVLRRAINGVYSKESVKNLKDTWKKTFFKKTGVDECQVKDNIRKEVIFRIFNLMDDFPFKRKFHVIFCRNVMIYFNQETKDRLIKKFYDMTEEGGYLFIGMSESLGKENLPYQYVMPSVYKKV